MTQVPVSQVKRADTEHVLCAQDDPIASGQHSSDIIGMIIVNLQEITVGP